MAELSDQLAPYGIDYVDAMDRFDNNADLYKRLALKYEADEHYVSLVAAMEAKDYDQGYKEAHGLKGVAGNLSFRTLYDEATIISDALKSGEMYGAEQHMEKLGAAQQNVLKGLEVLAQA